MAHRVVRRVPAAGGARGDPRGGARGLRRQGRAARGRGRRDRRVPARRRYDALRAADFHAPHIPVEYGGAGADALATAIVIEEVARACASSSLIPAVNKLGTMPLLLAGSDELKQRYLPAGRRRRGDVLVLPVRAGGRQRRRVDDHPGGPRRRLTGCSTA